MQFPVQSGNDQAVTEALNYLLSGPGGLGQNFAGFSSYAPGWLTGNFRIPYNQTTVAQLYVAPINIATVEMLDPRTVKITFSGYIGSTPPFALGNGLTFTGISGNYDYVLKEYGIQIGVVECTTTYVIVRLLSDQPLMSPGSGGTVQYSSINFTISTDCVGRVNVTGGTDRVFISAQLDNTFDYTVLSGTAAIDYTVQVRRLVGFLNEDPTNPDYLFNNDAYVSVKTYSYTGLTGSGTIPLVETIFATIIDQPPIGFYRYEIQVRFDSADDVQVTTSNTTVRSLSAQVVKQ